MQLNLLVRMWQVMLGEIMACMKKALFPNTVCVLLQSACLQSLPNISESESRVHIPCIRVG